jgi:hypothetical protein
MSNSGEIGNVVSGVEYAVVSVNGHAPGSVNDFMEEPVVVVHASTGAHEVTICGSPRGVEDCVILYEKDHAGTGKDIRTWLVREHDGRFSATERSVF